MARSKLYPPSVDSGMPVEPVLPAAWTRTTFKDVLQVMERPVRLDGGQLYTLVNAKRSRGGIVRRGELLGKDILTKTQFEVHAGDFLISRRQIIHGACGVVPPDLHGSIVSNEYAAIRTASSLSMDYLRQFCHTSYFQRTCFHSSHGVDVEKMVFKLDKWLTWPFHLPPLPEQRKIAAILSSVDDTIEKTQAVIDQLQVVKKAMMQELLTRGIPGRHTRFKKTEIGEVPEEWEVVPLDQVAIVQTGIAKNKKGASNGLEVPYLRVANVQDSYVDLSEIKTIIVEPGALGRYSLHNGDVLFTEGGDADKLGRGCVWRGQVQPCLHQNHIFAVRSNERYLLPDFLAYAAASAQGKAYFLGCAKQTTNLASINSTQLRAFPVPLAPIEEQRKIIDILSGFDNRILAERNYLEVTKGTQSALLSVLLTGEVRVTPDDEDANP